MKEIHSCGQQTHLHEQWMNNTERQWMSPFILHSTSSWNVPLPRQAGLMKFDLWVGLGTVLLKGSSEFQKPRNPFSHLKGGGGRCICSDNVTRGGRSCWSSDAKKRMFHFLPSSSVESELLFRCFCVASVNALARLEGERDLCVIKTSSWSGKSRVLSRRTQALYFSSSTLVDFLSLSSSSESCNVSCSSSVSSDSLSDTFSEASSLNFFFSQPFLAKSPVCKKTKAVTRVHENSELDMVQFQLHHHSYLRNEIDPFWSQMFFNSFKKIISVHRRRLF